MADPSSRRKMAAILSADVVGLFPSDGGQRGWPPSRPSGIIATTSALKIAAILRRLLGWGIGPPSGRKHHP